MALPIIEIRYLETIHSPFSGQPADGDNGPNEADPTLLFTYYGDIGEYGWVSPRWESALAEVDEDPHPTELAQSLDIDGGFLIVVDADWNGINCYGFAPAEDKG